MTIKEIQAKQAKANVPFELAAQIRELMEIAKKAYGADWDDDGIEDQVVELAF